MAKFMTIDPLAFYCPHIHAGQIPVDAVEVSQTEYTQFLEGAQAGMLVGLSATTGRPELIERDAVADLISARDRMRVSRYQLRAALMARGILGKITRDIDTIATPEIQLAWADAAEFWRVGPVVSLIQAAAEMDAAEVDALFAEASRVTA